MTQRHKLHGGPYAGGWALVEEIQGGPGKGVVIWRLEGDEGRRRRMRLCVFRGWINPLLAGK